MLLIEPLNESHYDDLLPIVRDIRVMKYIGTGKAWDSDHLMALIRDAQINWASFQQWIQSPMDNKDIDYIWAITITEGDVRRAIGVVSILYRPVSTTTYYQLYNREKVNFIRIYIGADPEIRGKGYGTRALIDAVNFFHTYHADKPVHSYVDPDNEPSIKLMTKVDFGDGHKFMEPEITQPFKKESNLLRFILPSRVQIRIGTAIMPRDMFPYRKYFMPDPAYMIK